MSLEKNRISDVDRPVNVDVRYVETGVPVTVSSFGDVVQFVHDLMLCRIQGNRRGRTGHRKHEYGRQ